MVQWTWVCRGEAMARITAIRVGLGSLAQEPAIGRCDSRPGSTWLNRRSRSPSPLSAHHWRQVRLAAAMETSARPAFARVVIGPGVRWSAASDTYRRIAGRVQEEARTELPGQRRSSALAECRRLMNSLCAGRPVESPCALKSDDFTAPQPGRRCACCRIFQWRITAAGPWPRGSPPRRAPVKAVGQRVHEEHRLAHGHLVVDRRERKADQFRFEGSGT